MDNSYKKIREYIRPGKTVRIVLWCALLLIVILLLVSTVFKNNKDLATSEKFDAMNSAKETYSYIDVVGVSDWCYEYTYNDAKETFYVVLDTDGYMSFATINYDDFSKMRKQRLYWEGKTDAAPEPYRIYGEAWPLNASNRTWTELYKVSGAESADEFENSFGQMYLLGGYNPLEEVASALRLIALFLGLMWAIILLCCSPKMIKTRKSLRYLKNEGLLEDAAKELDENSTIGPCSIGEKFLIVHHQGVAIPISSVKRCTGYSNSIRLNTDILGEVIIADLKAPAAQEIFDALPIDGETVEVVRVKSK